MRALNEANNFLISWKWRPVVGSSKINSALSLVFPFTKKEANFILWASPPDKVEEDCPNWT